jgi:hypothetical protein
MIDGLTRAGRRNAAPVRRADEWERRAASSIDRVDGLANAGQLRVDARNSRSPVVVRRGPARG